MKKGEVFKIKILLLLLLIILTVPANQVFACGSLVGSLDTISLNDMHIQGSYLYATTTYSGFYVFDISNPIEPTEAGSVNVPGTSLQPLDITGNYAFAGGNRGHLYTINISNPQEPAVIGSIETRDTDDPYDYLRDIYIQGQYAYVTHLHSGLRIVDISDPENPQIVGSLSLGSESYDLTVSGSFAYVRTTPETHIVDVSDPLNPVLRGTFAGSGPGGMQVLWPYLYSANGGLQVVDISDPDNPEVVGVATTPKIAVDVSVIGSYAYIADGNMLGGAISLVDISDPLYPEYVCSLPLTGDVWKVTFSNSYLFVGGYYGIKVTQFPTVAQTPMSGPPGTSFTQWGTSFTPNSVGALYTRNPDGSEHYIQDINIDETGHFEIIYESPIDKILGTYSWWVIDGPSGIKSNEVSYEITEPQPVQVTLTLSLDPQTAGGVVIVPPDEVCNTSCVYNYDAGTQIELTASANEGWQFEYWDDGISCNYNNPLTIVMDEDKTLTAVFDSGNYKTFRCVDGDFRKNLGDKGGQCPIYVRYETGIPIRGNAHLWFDKAKEAGYATGYTPRISAIIVFNKVPKTDLRNGHVGIVTAIEGDQVTIRDSHWVDKHIVGEHTISLTNYDILGYIYCDGSL